MLQVVAGAKPIIGLVLSRSFVSSSILSIASLDEGGSFAMISDAIHSASDVLSTFVVMIGIKVSSKKPDEKHKYGHERFESVAAIVLAMLLAVVGFSIGYSALEKLISGEDTAVSA